ncbi:hypothetical protein Sru01_21830 [Sphaerisporangium rufum]|uniref:Uncharacterized protein n=1 Tax=Sphaerisporangium rufum TaxID=1381558 RepID=A0A919UXN8_9ACTN|nr:hypothetical protein [Sphaerisporangium rufum]GII77201.1 hypothetical protein Sru01_21830 [Sphaerisporangium rufum]
MRHFLGLLLGVVVTAILLAGAGWAAPDAARGMVSAAADAANAVDPARDTRALVGLGAMAVAGLLLGLVLTARISPLATFIPSMVMLSWTVVYALDVNRALGLAPTDPSMHPLLVQAGKGMQDLLAKGIFAMLGIALFVPVLFPSRWTGRRRDADDGYAEETVESPGGYY